MKLYIVRHGESEGNLNHRFQSATEVLTSLGEAQAKKLAKRFADIKVDRIVCSTMTRAQQTAQEIATVTGKQLQPNADFAEIKHPTEIVGKFHFDKPARNLMDQIESHSGDPDFHLLDEENHWDFIRRVERGLRSLEQYEAEEHVVVVAHGHVLRVLVGLIIFGTEFSPREFELFIHRVMTNNTGITVAEYTLERGWKLITYNDHVHLLD